MAKLIVKKASTDQTVYVFIQNSSVTTGAGLTGLTYASSGLVCYYVRPLAAAAALTLATQTVTGAHADGGFVEVDATNMPGIYRLDFSDAICATGVNSVVVMLKGATNMAPVTLEIQLASVDVNDSVRAGLTALPNAAAAASGGLPTVDANNRIAGIQGTKNDFDDLNDLTAAQVNAEVDTALDTAIPGSPTADSINERIKAIDTETAGLSSSVSGITSIMSTVEAVTGLVYARLGAFTGSGINTVLGFFQALFRSDASTPSDIGGTFDPATESVQAIRDRGDAAWVTGGDATAAGQAAIEAKIDTIDTVVDSILVDTTAIEVDTTSIETKVDTIDTVVDAILVDTADMQPKLGSPATDVSTDIAAVKADTAAILIDTADMQPKIGSPAVDLSADVAAIKADTAAILLDTGTDGVVVAAASKTGFELSATGNNAAADALLKRDLDQVEATAPVHSLTTVGLAVASKTEDDGAGSLNVYRTDGITVHMTKTVTTDATLEPIQETGVGA